MITHSTRPKVRSTSVGAAAIADRVDEVTRALSAQLSSEHLVSQARFVDQLLDLMNITDNPAIVATIHDILGDVHALSAVRGDRVADHLVLLATVAGLEAALG